MFRETALAVDGVVSAEFDCSDMFGGGWQRGKVVLRASSREEAFTAAASSVEGVASAEWDCNFQFGGGWVRSDIVLEATTEDEAVAVVEELLRAFAASPDLEDGWSTPQEYATEDRSIIVGAGRSASRPCRTSARYASTTASHPADTADRLLSLSARRERDGVDVCLGGAEFSVCWFGPALSAQPHFDGWRRPCRVRARAGTR